VLPLDVTCTILIFLLLFSVNLPYINIPCSKPHIHFPLHGSYQRICPSPRSCVTFCNLPNPHAGESPVVSCLLLLTSISGVISSIIWILRTYHAVITGTHLTLPKRCRKYKNPALNDNRLKHYISSTIKFIGEIDILSTLDLRVSYVLSRSQYGYH